MHWGTRRWGEEVPPRKHTHPVPPHRPGSAGQAAGLQDESKWQVFRALKKQQERRVARPHEGSGITTASNGQREEGQAGIGLRRSEAQI